MNSLPNSSLIAFVAVIVVVVLLSKISNMLNPKSKEYLIYMRMFFLIWIKDTCMYKLLKKYRILWSKTLLLQPITLWASHIAKCSTKTCFLHCLNILNLKKISLLDGKKIHQIKQLTTNRLYFNKREGRSTNTKQF